MTGNHWHYIFIKSKGFKDISVTMIHWEGYSINLIQTENLHTCCEINRVNGDLQRVKHQTGLMTHCAYSACFKNLFQHGCTWAVFSASSLSTILYQGQKMGPNTCAVSLFNIWMHVFNSIIFYIYAFSNLNLLCFNQ